MIKKRLRLNSDTLVYLCEVLRPMLQRGETRMEVGINIETQVDVLYHDCVIHKKLICKIERNLIFVFMYIWLIFQHVFVNILNLFQ